VQAVAIAAAAMHRVAERSGSKRRERGEKTERRKRGERKKES
jgi:hypothetical protein